MLNWIIVAFVEYYGFMIVVLIIKHLNLTHQLPKRFKLALFMFFFLVPFMLFWNIYGNFMIRQEMFKVEAPYQARGSGKQPIIVDPCEDGDCIPGIIINGTIANHTVTITEDGHGGVVITTEDGDDNVGPSPINIKEITTEGDIGYPKYN